jgi:hypothetical protein
MPAETRGGDERGPEATRICRTSHLFAHQGQALEVEVLEMSEADWERLGASFGARCSSARVGGGRVQVVRLAR